MAVPAKGQQYFFSVHEASSSLAETQVNELHLSSDKFLLLGTQTGLFIYDGNFFEPVYSPKGFSIPVTTIFSNKTMTLVGFQNGEIYELRRKNLHYFSSLPDSISAPIKQIIPYPGDKWVIASYGSGLFVKDRDKLHRVIDSGTHLFRDIYDMSIRGDSSFFIATDWGMFRCTLIQDTSGNYRGNYEPVFSNRIVTTLERDSFAEGTWMQTHENGWYFYDWNTETTGKVPYPGWDITAAQPMSESRLYCFSDSENPISVWNSRDRKFEHFKSGGTNLPIVPTSHFYDPEGILWIWCKFNGLLSTQLHFLEYNTNLNDIQAAAVRGDSIYIGTESGLFLLNPTNQTTIQLIEGYNILEIMPLENNSEIWCATFGGGILILDTHKNSFKKITEKDGLINDHVLSLYFRDDLIYATTLGGVSAFNPLLGQLEISATEKLPQSQYVYDILVDSYGNTWLGKDGRGLVKVNTDGEVEELLEDKTVYSIAELSSGNLIAATARTGLYHLYRDTLSGGYIEKNIFPSPTFGALTDKKENIIILTDYGLKISSGLSGVAISLGQARSAANSSYYINGFYKTKDGSIYMPAGSSILKYLPVSKQFFDPQLIVSKAVIGDKDLEENRKINVSHNHNTLELQFNGIWFYDPSKINYRYKLLGINEDWVETRNYYVLYPKLAPGDYQILVEASLDPDFRKATSFKASFVVEKPFWQTITFRIIMSVVIVGGLLWLTREIINRNRKKEQLKTERINSELQTLKSQIDPHFLFNNFNNIISLLEYEPGTAITYTKRLSDFYRSILTYRNEDLITLDKEVEIFNNYAALLRIQYGDNIVVKIEGETRADQRIVPLTLQILLENCLKHNKASSARPLKVNVVVSRNELTVSNPLQPKNSKTDSTHFGLESLNQRYRLLTGKEIKVYESKGWFYVSLPLIVK
nr:histidine kinase [Saprospiraceae bacterium]